MRKKSSTTDALTPEYLSGKVSCSIFLGPVQTYQGLSQACKKEPKLYSFQMIIQETIFVTSGEAKLSQQHRRKLYEGFFQNLRFLFGKSYPLGTSLVVKWLRTCLPMQRMTVQFWIRELRSHMLQGNLAHVSQSLSPGTSTRESTCQELQTPSILEPTHHSRAHPLQQKIPHIAMKTRYSQK